MYPRPGRFIPNLVTAIAFAPLEGMGSAGSYLATGSDDQTIKIWDYQTGELPEDPEEPPRVG